MVPQFTVFLEICEKGLETRENWFGEISRTSFILGERYYCCRGAFRGTPGERASLLALLSLRRQHAGCGTVEEQQDPTRRPGAGLDGGDDPATVQRTGRQEAYDLVRTRRPLAGGGVPLGRK